ncbi:unnamed protein product [Vitrella brassicaformis CCMP3155]|uniref:Uncharacterized protein n=2 Tax=Vitrella brassicaformis TaxID=1169539 RepID=A0A0G4ESM6_VITBC|nr:unnamed protein product [Vitrella brassicaformis CCMP3155]|eukprot:CEM01007.1 unnamed protein product [Vitrella brassicaformis CCMP3155]
MADREADGTRVPSFRLVHRSGQPPPINHIPARHCISRDAVANVHGHFHPRGLTRLRRSIGTPLFQQSASQYTHLSVTCSTRATRRLWQRMPLRVAHKWGERANHLRELEVHYPSFHPTWCMGTWVALLEGHGAARAGIARKMEEARRPEGGGSSGAASSEDQLRVEGTLLKLTFTRIEYPQPNASLRASFSHTSSTPLPPSGRPVVLPALSAVNNLPSQCTPVRVGREWRTPGIASISFDLDGTVHHNPIYITREEEEARAADVDAAPAWLLPQRLEQLRTVGCLYVPRGTDAADISALRQELVRRGCNKTFTKMPIFLGYVGGADADKRRLCSLAYLHGAVMDPLCEPEVADPTTRAFKMERDDSVATDIIAWAQAETSCVKKLVAAHAKAADTIVYRGGRGTHLAGISSDMFGERDPETQQDPVVFKLQAEEVSEEDMEQMAKIVAGMQEQWLEVTVAGAAAGENTVDNDPRSDDADHTGSLDMAARFLAKLHQVGGDIGFNMDVSLDPAAFADAEVATRWREASQLFADHHPNDLTVFATGEIPDDMTDAQWYERVLDLLVAFYETGTRGRVLTTGGTSHIIEQHFDEDGQREQAYHMRWEGFPGISVSPPNWPDEP